MISGGPSAPPLAGKIGYVYLLDLGWYEIAGTVTGVGNDPYGIVVVDR